MSARVLLVCVTACVLAFASLAEEPKEVKETKLTPTFIFSGSHTAIDRETFAVVKDETAWKALWKKHRGDEKTRRFTEGEQYFDIDFDTQYVVAVFPATGQCCDITPRKRGNEILIGFRAPLYSIEGRLGPDTRTEHEKAKERAVSPYAFVVLPKPVRTVVIEKDVRKDKFAAPEWKEVQRFQAPKGNK